MAYTFEQVYLKTTAYPWPYFHFLEWNGALIVHDYNVPVVDDGQILTTADGDTWNQLFLIDHDVAGISKQAGGNTDYDLIVYDGTLWIGQYEGSTAYTNARILEWDGSTITQHLNSVASSNMCAFSFVIWAGRLWCITDITPFQNNNRRYVYNFTRSAGWTVIADYDGATYLDYNKVGGNPTMPYLTSKLLVSHGGLYLFATRYDSVNAKWGWQVWRFNTVTWNSFSLLYETYDDYALSNVMFYGSKTLLFVNEITAAGVFMNAARFYSSYDMLNWTVDGDDANLGAVCSSEVFNEQIFLNCHDTISTRTRIYIYSLETKSATLEEEITTYTFGSATGGLISWGLDLYAGKSMEIMRRTPRELPGAGEDEDDGIERDKMIVLTNWTFKAADGTTINLHLAPIDVRGPDVFYEGRILSMSGAERATDDRTGLPSVGDMTVEIANHDKAISIILHYYPIWKNQIVQVWYAKRNEPEALKSETAVMAVSDYYEKGPNYVVTLKDLNRKYFDIEIPEDVTT